MGIRQAWEAPVGYRNALGLLLIVAAWGCGDGATEGPKKIVSTVPVDAGADGGTSSGADAALDAGSSGASSGSAGDASSGAATDSGTDDTSADASSGGTSSGGDATFDASALICVNDQDCAALLPDVGPCAVGRCVNNQCQPGPADDGAACDDGVACTEGDACVGGSCKGGTYKCDDANPCTDDSCAAATGVCTHKPLPGDLLTQCDDGDSCTAGDTCDGIQCVGKKTDCDDGNPCTDDACAAGAGCKHTNNTKPCGDVDKCYAQGVCTAGKCAAGDKMTCDDSNDCTTDTCDAKTGKCTYTPGTKVLCEDGDACTKGDTCKAGKCDPGAAKACDDANPCTDDGCEPSTGACFGKPNTKACDDGDLCTLTDACKNAVCLGGAATGCDDNKPCTDDVCDPKKGCLHSENTAVCSDDATCKLGVCKLGTCEVGDKAGCNDNNPCTTDTCTAGKCAYKALADGGKCADGSKCQKTSVCTAGKCKAGALEDCSDANPCTTDGCNPATGCVWQANTSACDDGDACTTGDDCATGTCKGAPKTGLCDDANVCTADACDPKTGCVHTPVPSDKPLPCDDGNSCTKGEHCAAGKCGGGADDVCADGKDCTVDSCNPTTGQCSWSARVGPCDDGNECTTGDVCKVGKCVPTGASDCSDANPCTVDTCDDKAGKCLHVVANPTNAPILCDDGDLCTTNDMCSAGKCIGGPGGLSCDDGNACTDDGCDAKTGKCGFSANIAPCDANNLCTFGDRCKNGKCAAGTAFACDDGQTCTTDSCDAKDGKCAFKTLADGSACSDGDACSTGDGCVAGKCTAKDTSKCALFTATFGCAQGAKGWTLQNTSGRKVIWAIDDKPDLGKDDWGCNLNFNNDVNYCDKYTASNSVPCYTPSGIAYSPYIDATKVKGVPRLAFDTWYDLDSGNTDTPRVELRSETNQYLYGFNLDKGKGKQWRHMALNVPQVKGTKFRMRFYLTGASGYGGNEGKGWFVDNIVLDEQYTDEVCNDGVDNDNNGQTDCLDIACKGTSSCKEICDDGKDNNYDDKVDCADSSCAGALECSKPVFEARMDCGDKGWHFKAMNRNDVAFAIDSDAIAPTPISGKCTLNFNNGKNFCGKPSCAASPGDGDANANAGMATWGGFIDATSYKSSLTLVYWSWIDAEPYGGNAYYDDRGFVMASYDGFAGCCGATNVCSSSAINECNKTATSTWIAPRTAAQQKQWQKVTLNLYKFRGRKFQLRLRFNSGDGNANSGAGWFVDDVRIYGK